MVAVSRYVWMNSCYMSVAAWKDIHSTVMDTHAVVCIFKKGKASSKHFLPLQTLMNVWTQTTMGVTKCATTLKDHTHVAAEKAML